MTATRKLSKQERRRIARQRRENKAERLRIQTLRKTQDLLPRSEEL